MKRTQILVTICFFLIFIIIVGCSKDAVDDEELEPIVVIEEDEEDLGGEDIVLNPYAEEIGFSLEGPTKDLFAADTTIEVHGNVDKVDDLQGEYIWVSVRKIDPQEEIDKKEFNYYIPFEKGLFSEQMVLHSGAGEYHVIIRAPSNKVDEKDRYYDVASFEVINNDDGVKREIEFTQFGLENNIKMISPKIGLDDATTSVFIEGNVPDDYKGDIVLVEVEKDYEHRQVSLPVQGNSFSGDVPLNFGLGHHLIKVQTFNENDELYYESASFYVDNLSSAELAEYTEYEEYNGRGVSLAIPTLATEMELDEQEYRIAGEIDPTVAGAADIDYMIVSVNEQDEGIKSDYVIPVLDYKFDGVVYFRFGSGSYDVVISVPDKEKQDGAMFYYQGVVKLQHEVSDVEDDRDLLPSRGVDSDEPIIIDKAKEITAGLDNDYDKAKAIYKFVAQHVAYDVEKAERDLFSNGDNGLATLKSGTGICQDYAFLATALLRAIGMESHYVGGYANGRHAWVEVKVDGEWIEMDPTWGSGYIKDNDFHFDYNEDYFDPDPEFLAKTHKQKEIMY